jgi:hypothetical protein
MLTLWLPINGKFVEVLVNVSEELYTVAGKQHHLCQHDGSGFRYLATEDAVKKMIADSDEVAEIMKNA